MKNKGYEFKERYGFRPISSVHGRIEEVLFINHNAALNNQAIAQRYHGIAQHLGDHITTAILVRYSGNESHKKGIDDLKKALETPGKGKAAAKPYILLESQAGLAHLASKYGKMYFEPRVGPAEDNPCEYKGKTTYNDRWAQDPFVMLESNIGVNAILESGYTERGLLDLYVAEQVAAKWGLVIKPTKYFMEGGNILADEDFVILGSDLLRANLNFFKQAEMGGEDAETITRKLGKAFGNQKVLWMGIDPNLRLIERRVNEAEQALFHLDLYLTLGGRYDGKYQVFLAEIQDENIVALNGETGNKIPDEISAVQTRLENAEKWFDAAGKLLEIEFKVNRIPMVVSWRPNQSPNSNSEFVINWYSFNNCFVEVYPSTTQMFRNVYLPKYSQIQDPLNPQRNGHSSLNTALTKAEGKVEKMFMQRGFSPVWVEGNFSIYVAERGSLHCMTKVLRRSIQCRELIDERRIESVTSTSTPPPAPGPNPPDSRD